MATPYRQLRFEIATSTQDVAREAYQGLPVLVIAPEQSQGRGRSGSPWLTAPRALAVSAAFEVEQGDLRPFSLIAGVAAVRVFDDATLKWPNDLVTGDKKAGGILVERIDDLLVVGLGVNLWWADPPFGVIAMSAEDPGPAVHAECGALWGAELVALVESEGWPIDEYRSVCTTLGREISWEPDGTGRALDIADSGGLVVESATGVETLHAGSVRHVR